MAAATYAGTALCRHDIAARTERWHWNVQLDH